MKFIFHNSSGFSPSIHVLHKRPQLLLERAPSFHSNDTHSTVLSEANTEESRHQVTHRNTNRRRVCFNEQCNQTYKNTQLCREEVAELWFSREDFASFRRNTTQQAQLLLEGERSVSDAVPEPTTTALLQAYQGLQNVQTSADIVAVLQSHQFKLHYTYVGLDRLLVPTLFQDKVERRKRIARQIDHLQRSLVHDFKLRQDKIRQVSRSISQPSRLYAHYVAQLAARSGTH